MVEVNGGQGFVVPAIPNFEGHYDHLAKLMESFIRSKEYWDLIEHGITLPTERVLTEAQQKTLNDQKLKVLKLKNFLYQAISRNILDTIISTDISKEI
uniref:Uncharacterized protein n=1 Tax=Lactuca sativa TaxID=4236 RepID=A0A9R1VNS2_LACSA|nr:hypothetical protein LSAT_V11C500291780 [Lactuca sativa]